LRGVEPFFDRMLARLARRTIQVVALRQDAPDGESPDWVKLCDEGLEQTWEDQEEEEVSQALSPSEEAQARGPEVSPKETLSAEASMAEAVAAGISGSAQPDAAASPESDPDAERQPLDTLAAAVAQVDSSAISDECHPKQSPRSASFGTLTDHGQEQGASASAAQQELRMTQPVQSTRRSPANESPEVQGRASALKGRTSRQTTLSESPDVQSTASGLKSNSRQGFPSESPDAGGRASGLKGRMTTLRPVVQVQEPSSSQGSPKSVWPTKSLRGNRQSFHWRSQVAETHQAGTMLQMHDMHDLLQMHEMLHQSQLRSASVPPITEVAGENVEDADDDDQPTSLQELARNRQSSSVPPERLAERCELARSTRGLSMLAPKTKSKKTKGQASTFDFLADLDRSKKLSRFVRGKNDSSDSDNQEEEEGESCSEVPSRAMWMDLDAPECTSSKGTGRGSVGRESVKIVISDVDSKPLRKSRLRRSISAAKVLSNFKSLQTPSEEKGPPSKKSTVGTETSSTDRQLQLPVTPRSKKSMKGNRSSSAPNEDEEKARDTGSFFQRNEGSAKRKYRKSLLAHGLGLDGAANAARGPSFEVDSADYDICANLSKKHQMSMEEVRWRLHEFQQLDSNKNKVLTKHEFEEAIRRYLNMPAGTAIPPHLFDTHWLTVDFNSNGKVDFEEFLAWTIKTAYTEEVLVPNPHERNLRRIARANNLCLPDVERIKKTFDEFDEDKSDSIDDHEFKSVLLALLKVKNPGDISTKKLQRWWREIDVDGSGTVSFEEFLLWYIKYFESH